MQDLKELKIDHYYSPAQCMIRLLKHPGISDHLDPAKPSIWHLDVSTLTTLSQASFKRAQHLAKFRDLL